MRKICPLPVTYQPAIYLFFLFLTALSCPAQITLRTSHLSIAISAEGNITSFKDKSGREWLAPGEPAALMSVFAGGKLLRPSTLRWQPNSKSIILNYPGWQGQATIRVSEKSDYVVFELTALKGDKEVAYITWGPYPTSIREHIGETVGTVWNEHFGIGIQALNLKTLGGAPTQDNDIEPAYDIFQESSVKDISPDRTVLYRGQTARPENFGSILQAYARNRYTSKVVANWGHERYEVPAYRDDGGVQGSRIALWGAPAGQLLNVIERIELGEGLPHPTLDGVWAKKSPLATSSYFIMEFSDRTLEEAITFTEKAGLKYLYHPGPFATWGHFNLNPQQFPNGVKDLKQCVDAAGKRGIRLGVHTLSSFITPTDAYVTPVPDPRLARVGTSVLTHSIDEKTTTLTVASSEFFNQMQNNTLRTVMIGTELIRYREVSEQAPWVLRDCIRGAWGTKAQSHADGDTIAKLMDHPYKVFLPDVRLQEEIATRLAHLYNETGLRQISFDGLEGSWSTGLGQYGTQLFVKTWYDALNPTLKGHVINDASGPGHFYWHIFTRMNWGEPWYAGFRESQTQYRLRNQDYFRRNLIPAMLGWFQLTATTSMEDLEWLLARAAGFDAGFALSTGIDALRQHADAERILMTIRDWETARLSGAFSEKQKAQLRDINREFQLRKAATGTWQLLPVAISRFDYVTTVKQPGEPTHANFTFNNPHSKQPLQLTASLRGDHASKSVWSNPVIEINGYDRIEIPVALSTSETLVCDGKKLTIIDSRGAVVREISVTVPTLNSGDNSISLDGPVSGDNQPAVRIEIRTIGEGESIGR